MTPKLLWIIVFASVVNGFTLDTVFTGATFYPSECSQFCSHHDGNAFTTHNAVIECLEAMPQNCAIMGFINTVIRADDQEGKYPICLDTTTGSIGFDLSAWIDFVRPTSVNLYGIKPEDTESCIYHINQLQTALGEDDCIDERSRNIPRKVIPNFRETANGFRISVDLNEQLLNRLFYRYQLTYTIDISEFEGDVRAQGVIVAPEPTPTPAMTTNWIEIPADKTFLPCRFYPEADDYRDIRIQYLAENTTLWGRQNRIDGAQVSLQVKMVAAIALLGAASGCF